MYFDSILLYSYVFYSIFLVYLFRHNIPKLVEVNIFIPSKDKTTIELEQVINQAGKV